MNAVAEILNPRADNWGIALLVHHSVLTIASQLYGESTPSEPKVAQLRTTLLKTKLFNVN